MKNAKRTVSCALMAISFLMVVGSLFLPQMKGDTNTASKRISHVVASRLKTLDTYAQKALEGDATEWMDLGKLPEDMVVYRYVSDRLQSWENQFPIGSDDIIPRSSARWFANSRSRVNSPLSRVGDQYSFFQFGSKAYLIKKFTSGNVKVIAGLSIEDNPKYRMDSGFDCVPMDSNEGTAVCLYGEPLFRVKYDAMPVKSVLPANIVWIAFLIFCVGLLLSLSLKPYLKNALWRIALMIALAVGAFVRHPVMQGEITQILIILVINVLVFMVAMCLYMARNDIWSRVRSKAGAIALSALDSLVILALLVLAFLDIFKVINYTHICLELYKIGLLSLATGLVYATFLLMYAGLVMLILLLFPKRRLNLLGRVSASLFFAIFTVGVTFALGFDKDEMIISQWAENLANERDITMENHLRRIEKVIAGDEILARASESEELAEMARGHLIDRYFFRSIHDYNVYVRIGNENGSHGLENGVQIAPDSRFYYAPLVGQRCRYIAAFHYFIPDRGQNTVYLIVEPKGMGATHVDIPARFSYAKYNGRDRQYYRGAFAYPTRITEDLYNNFKSDGFCHFALNGYTHFVNEVSKDEFIVISRREMGALRTVLATLFIAILLFFLLGIIRYDDGGRRSKFGKNYFKSVVTLLVLASLTITMAALATVSVSFVYERNEANARMMMSDRINAIRATLQSSMANITSTEELTTRETMDILRKASETTMANISLFRPDGRVFMSTTPERFDRMMAGCRVNGRAYQEIMYLNRGFSIIRENYGEIQSYTMYAPILGADGQVVCLFASPYRENGYDFQLDAVVHSVSIVIVFIILLMVSSLLVSFITDRIFNPLSEMRKKMEKGGLDSLEHISYTHDDEILSIVQSYNRMVDDLAASSRSLAQAERDKAWSEMARNVAHEIKNPLTPMQLQIQRVQRLKANGSADWQSKFDDMAKVLLDHIEVLTETANQFSDFAKLYSEEPVEIRLDDLLREEVAMYDSRPGVEFEYLGLPDAVVNGPKPQLVRVFVNLLNNAVQACEEVDGAKVAVSLRNSSDPDFLEIVFEDNGPGVDEENVSKLFTPKFTTKSSGSGLGLSICHSILERCGASISYSRSFRLGGASFTIRYPKN